MKYEIEYIEKIAKIVAENQLTEITLEDGEKAIVIKKESTVVAPAAIAAAPAVTAPSSAPAVAAATVAKEEKTSQAKGTPITSPMVGAFYAAPAPGAKPFVKVGDTVSAGQVVCIVEAMKLMNEIESEVSGKVVEICVEDGQSVEYGQVLMYVE
ncbi:acetyl-CoA carboxylase biotin carboxyl carrier protein [bacterium]|nr:acetyl-CoA carboxylase biotin carboxyl carrier protein [bacterium]MBQ9149801.1 acetyl-CoA carboxylase biotin carboxyl carrier protein [bacterium]